MRVDRLEDLVIFTRAAKLGSLSAAARDLGLSAAVVSKRLIHLEQRLGVRLVNRTTRSLSLTDEGAGYYDQCVRLLAQMEEAETAVTQGHAQPVGTLRATIPASFGRLHIAPLLPAFMQRYPSLRLHLHLSDGTVDLVEDGYDVAVRISDLKDSTLVARPLATDRRVVVASPEYLARHGAPRTPADLAQHNCLLFANPLPQDHWRFVGPDGGEHRVQVAGNLETNNCEALRETVLAGVGIALRPTWDVGRDVRSGAVRVLLPGYTPHSVAIQAVYPSRRHLSAKVRVFVEFLRAQFGAQPYWDAGVERAA
jgi:DNA-binding transcriptional LysR family regulator